MHGPAEPFLNLASSCCYIVYNVLPTRSLTHRTRKRPNRLPGSAHFSGSVPCLNSGRNLVNVHVLLREREGDAVLVEPLLDGLSKVPVHAPVIA